MIRRPPRSTQSRSSAASDVYKRQRHRSAVLFVRTQTNGSRTYLLIVDNKWVRGKVKQHVLLRLGRLDELLASGQLDSLIRSLGRFSEKLAVLGAHARGDSITTRSARIGPALIFQRLWQTCSIDKVLMALLEGRFFEFSCKWAMFR